MDATTSCDFAYIGAKSAVDQMSRRPINETTLSSDSEGDTVTMEFAQLHRVDDSHSSYHSHEARQRPVVQARKRIRERRDHVPSAARIRIDPHQVALPQPYRGTYPDRDNVLDPQTFVDNEKDEAYEQYVRDTEEERRLRQEPLYQFAQLVAGQTGQRLDELIHVRNFSASARVRFPGVAVPPVPAVPVPPTAIGPRDDPPPGTPVRRATVPDPIASPARAAPRRGPSMLFGAASRQDKQQYLTLLGASARQPYIVEQPLLVSNSESAFVRVVQANPRLRQTTIRELQASPVTRILFAELVASLIGLAMLRGYRRPYLQATHDWYRELGEAALRQFRCVQRTGRGKFVLQTREPPRVIRSDFVGDYLASLSGWSTI